jgi:1,4-dihydroxy-2-naphthoyl-CoA hydrolase
MSFTYHRTVRFADTDAAGVVYFANVLSIGHEAYEASLIAAGIDAKTFFRGATLAVPIVHATVDFHRPIQVGDSLKVHVTPQETSRHEFEVRYEIWIDGQDRSASQALTRHVCIDAKSRSRVFIPAMLKQWIVDLAP